MKRLKFNKHAGARNELAATVWLLENGYEVFRNVSHFGLIDLVAIKEDEVLRIDVKATAISNKTGKPSISSYNLSKAQKDLGIIRLNVYPDMSCEIVSAISIVGRADAALRGNCLQCQVNFPLVGQKVKFCSKKCGSDYHRHRLRLERNRKRESVSG